MSTNEKLWHSAVIFALAIPFFINLGVSSLWDANESFYAETPREMLETRDFLAPQFNYQPRTQKPPLTYWAIALSYAAFGITEFAVRLPGALAALGVVIFTYLTARLLHSPPAALIAALATATTLRVFILARRLPIDILLLFMLAATAFFLIRGLMRDSSWNWALAYVCSGLAFLTKGPVGVLIPFGAYLAWALGSRTFRLRRMRPILGGMLFFAVVFPWYLAIYLRSGWTYIAAFFLRDNLGRFASDVMGPSRGPFFYLGSYLADFFPWSVLSLAALAGLWLRRRVGAFLSDPAWGLPLAWCALVFATFTLSKNKQEYYIAPVYPMMSVIMGGLIDRWFNAEGRSIGVTERRIWQVALFASAALLLAAGSVAPLILRSILPEVPVTLEFGPSLLIFAGAAAVIFTAWHRHMVAAVVSLGACVWLLLLFSSVFVLPRLETLRPIKSICASLKPNLVPDDEVGYYRATAPSMVFYLGRPVFEEFDADRMIDRFRSGKRVFCVMSGEDLGYFVGNRGLSLYVLDRRPRLTTRLRDIRDDSGWRRRMLHLVSNRAPATN